jgi:hypothetical protein
MKGEERRTGAATIEIGAAPTSLKNVAPKLAIRVAINTGAGHGIGVQECPDCG